MARKKRSRKSAGRRRRSRKAFSFVKLKENPRRRRRRSSHRRARRYHRNPSSALSLGGVLPNTGLIKDAVYITGGFIGTKMAANYVLPMIGVSQPIVRIGVKAVLAGVVGMAGKAVLGKSAGQYLMIGGLVEAVNDAIQTFVAPYVPQLAMSNYPELSAYTDMGSYASLSGLVQQDADMREQV